MNGLTFWSISDFDSSITEALDAYLKLLNYLYFNFILDICKFICGDIEVSEVYVLIFVVLTAPSYIQHR